MTYGKVYEPNNAESRAEAIETLQEIFPPDSVAHTVVRHVTRSGSMSRAIHADTGYIRPGGGLDAGYAVSNRTV